MSRDDGSAAQQVQKAFTKLMRWAQRADVRRSLIGGAAETLSTNDITLLRAIVTHGPVRVSDLASWQGVDKSTVTPQVRRLEERHLIARHGDPGDKRAALLTATDHGRQRLQEVDTVIVRLFERALDGWSSSDGHALAALMQRFVDRLTDTPQNGTSDRSGADW
jgi:DNA-binding MarR family transcriptional regulator